MNGRAYYNEIDPFAAQWLRNLIAAGLIAPGEVDERSISDVRADDIAGFTQCHFFAGIAGWSYALRLAGWPDDRPVWTGSCPCQPFSVAGQGRAEKDERHLWPEFKRLIEARKPAIVFGEQVASNLGREWLAGVFADLEAMAYQRAGADLCAAGVGAPHIRQRLVWMAYAEHTQRGPFGFDRENGCDGPHSGRAQAYGVTGTRGEVRRMAVSESEQSYRCWHARRGRREFADCGDVRLAYANGGIESHGDLQRSGQHGQRTQDASVSGLGDADNAGSQGRIERGHRADQWVVGTASLVCLDGRTRRIPIEPRFQPLADGVSARVGRLRAYGNAIVPQIAAQFIAAFLETERLAA